MARWWWLLLVLLFFFALVYFVWHSQRQVEALDKELTGAPILKPNH